MTHRVGSYPSMAAGLPDNRRRWIRRLAWLGLTGSVALAVASAASYWLALVYLGPSYQVWFVGGGLLIQPSPAPVNGGLHWADATIPPKPLTDRIRGWFLSPRGMGSGSLFVPLGPPVAILAALSSFILWRTKRRIPQGLCRQCGYNLTGLVHIVCPECGASVEPVTLSSSKR